MPRARVNHKLIRIPIQPEIAYDLAYYYDPRKDQELLVKHEKKLGKLAEHFLSTIIHGRLLTPKQRLVILQMEFPTELRLKAIKACIGKGSKKWDARFREDPRAAYKEEEEAVQRALRDLQCEAKIMETVA